MLARLQQIMVAASVVLALAWLAWCRQAGLGPGAAAAGVALVRAWFGEVLASWRVFNRGHPPVGGTKGDGGMVHGLRPSEVTASGAPHASRWPG